MNISDLVLLTKAGFTKDDIMALSAGNADPAPEDDRLKQLETKLDYVVNRFNYLAVQNSKQPEEKTETIEDILASVIK